jgi:CRP-like cAMP-binding protein
MGAAGGIAESGEASRAVIRRAFGCDAAVADVIAALARDTALPRGAVLWPRSEPGESTLVMSGLAHEVAYGRDGGMLILHRLGPGDLFGDLLHEVGETATQVEGVVEGRGALFAGAALVRLMESYGSVGLAVSRQLSHRLAGLQHRMVETALLSVSGRICAELLRRSVDMPDRTIRPMPVMSELAVSVSSTRETVSRTVSQLERRGLVKRVEGGLTIVAPHRLEEQVY